MNGKALGIIETVGLVPAVEAGDVALKTADVTILGSQAVGGGFVSILMTGDVSAVKASIDAGSAAAARLGEVSSVTVISRTAEGLDEILIEETKGPKFFPGSGAPADLPPEPVAEAEVEAEPVVEAEAEVEAETAPVPLPEAAEGDAAGEIDFDLAELKKWKVTKLRRLARQLPAFPIPRGEIKFAKKKDLLEAFSSIDK